MLYLSSLLKKRHPKVVEDLKQYIDFKEIPNTRDIWIRDFMPIKNTADEYILFRYFPKYLRNPKYKLLISDNHSICKELKIKYSQCDLILDGGSVIYYNEVYFVSERIYKDNPLRSKTKIIKTLEDIFKTDKVILLPEYPSDFTGHLDGVLRILDDKTILLNDYRDEYGKKIKKILHSYNFTIETLPYNPYSNKTYQSAKGIYTNFIYTDTSLFFPIFQQKEDELALYRMQQLFPKKIIIPILCNDLAKEGGLLHCVSWERKN